jgi:Membrane domain of glycerophosphoryl diester phosphodiesterase
MASTIGRSPATFSFFELLDSTFRLYRENFATYVGLVAVLLVPISVITLVLSYFNLSSLPTTSTLSRSRELPANTGLICLSSLITLVLAVVEVVAVNGSLTYAASENYLGRKVSISEAFSGSRHRFTNLGCGYAIFFAILFGCSIIIGLIGAACSPVFAGLGVVAYVGIATYAFLVPVLVLENVQTFAGVNRAWALGKARFWTVFGLIVAFAIINTVLNLAFGGLVRLMLVQSIQSTSSMAAQVVNVVITNVISIFLTPILPIGLTLLYFDTRNRFEGLDFALQAAGTPEPRPSDVLSPTPQAALTSRDAVNMLVLVGAALLIGIVANSLLQAWIRSLGPNGLNF